MKRSDVAKLKGLAALDAMAPRMKQVAEGAARGLSNDDIARMMGIAEGTVKATMNSVFRKTGLTRMELVRDWARREGQESQVA